MLLKTILSLMLISVVPANAGEAPSLVVVDSTTMKREFTIHLGARWDDVSNDIIIENFDDRKSFLQTWPHGKKLLVARPGKPPFEIRLVSPVSSQVIKDEITGVPWIKANAVTIKVGVGYSEQAPLGLQSSLRKALQELVK